ncbi:MAG TPA: bifunctional adenosylcobinamide kinase/adenosylcobinamide-phosphate guanylyltransferase [Candidatus Binatia bacterium]|jgi:adenosylcobinamide kinase/adenosylcobinamide-phosphate guanylyltransferase|nr:bifunctional adenosylcobinamide kinase/adenosylcobinamide-phosphate guanylyltransferase [Candidatus Binatia bacterium]
MAKEIILITGGARSGKSRYAEGRAAALGARRLYIATAEPKDEEMARRIDEHKLRRRSQWLTVEEPVELCSVLLAQCGRIDAALVDCVTLWLSNLILREDENLVEHRVRDLLEILPRLDFHALFVTNEVGSGIVPENALARGFRDLAGSVNQRLAAVAGEVVFMVTGIPLIVKKAASCS